PRYHAELDRWVHAYAESDGIPKQAVTSWPDAHISDVPLRDFTREAHYPHPDSRDRPPTVERDALILLGSDTDDRVGWLRSGRALATVLLILPDAGLTSQPLGPATDLPAIRTQLQRSLGLLGHPQLLMRIGYGHGQPRTARRPVDEILSLH